MKDENTHKTDDGLVIKTYYDPKPIPTRAFDWCARLDDYDAGDPLGYGASEADAIRDLKEEIEHRNN